MNIDTLRLLVQIGREAEEKKWVYWSEAVEARWGEKVRAINWYTSFERAEPDCVFSETKEGRQERQWFSKGIMLVLCNWRKTDVSEKKEELSNKSASFEQTGKKIHSSQSPSLLCSLM